MISSTLKKLIGVNYLPNDEVDTTAILELRKLQNNGTIDQDQRVLIGEAIDELGQLHTDTHKILSKACADYNGAISYNNTLRTYEYVVPSEHEAAFNSFVNDTLIKTVSVDMFPIILPGGLSSDVQALLNALTIDVSPSVIGNKVVVDAPALDNAMYVNRACRFTGLVGSSDFNCWAGVCEELGKLTLTGQVTLQVRNRTGFTGVKSRGTPVFIGDIGLYSAGYLLTTTNTNSDLTNTHNIIGELAEDYDFSDTTSYFEVQVILQRKSLVTEPVPEYKVVDTTASVKTTNMVGVDSFISLGYEYANDGGGFSWKKTGNTVPGSAGTFNRITGMLYDTAGVEFTLNPNDSRVPCTAVGMFPDGTTDWWGNSVLPQFIQYLSSSEYTGVFVKGEYACGYNCFYSNVSIYGEQGAMFYGTIHIAINSDVNNPAVDRPQNINWYGFCGTYSRVGSYNCDHVYVENIVQLSDSAKETSGNKGGGVHIYGGTNDMYVDNIYVEAVERSAGLAIDYDSISGQNPPTEIHIDRCYVKKSFVHGSNFVGNNITVNELSIDEYGAGATTDPKINYGLSGSAASVVGQAVGISIGAEAVNVHIGKANIQQLDANSIGNGKSGYDGIACFGQATFNELIIRNSTSKGVNNYTAGKLIVGNLDVRLSTDKNIRNIGILKTNTITSTYCESRGIECTAGELVANDIYVENNDLHGIYLTTCKVNIGRIHSTINNKDTKDYSIFINAVSGSINCVDSSKAASGNGGGLYITGNCSGLVLNSVKTLKECDSASYASVFLNAASNFNIRGLRILGDDTASSWQPLRLVNSNNFNIYDMVIEDQFNGFGIAHSTISNIGFVNCNNKTLVTSIPAGGSIAEFNCTSVTS